MKNSITWFEIPVNNFDRAKKFYEAVLSIEMHVMAMEETGSKWGFFPFDAAGGGVGGGIVQGQGYEPSNKGSLLYLHAGDDLSNALSKVQDAGGEIVLPKTAIGPNGFMAHFIDTEGNKVALHSKA